MTPRPRRGRAIAWALAVLCAGCGAKPVVLAPPPGAARFPEIAYPEPPAGSPADAVDRHKAAWQWLQMGDLRAAERVFAATLKDHPSFYPAETGLGDVAIARKDYKEAIGHFDRAIGADAAYVPALVGRGDAWLALGQRDQALASFVAAAAIDPSSADLQRRVEVLQVRALQEHVAVARQAAEEGRYAQASAAYEQAIVASPQSPFLYRELADVERRDNRLTAALEHAQKAATLEPTDVRHVVLVAEILEAQGDLERAADTYLSAVALEPNPELSLRIDALRQKAAFAALPDEFKNIETSPTVTRAQLAALFGVRLEALFKRAPRVNPPVMTDTRGSWAETWILSVARAGVMEPYPNHAFLPDGMVRRGDLAVTVSRVLTLLTPDNPTRAVAWRNARRKFPDLSPAHLSYPAASMAVEAGVMAAAADGAFQLARAVTGEEALSAVKKLEDLAWRRSR